jgi:ribosomal protein L3 glutamine methyltransferase
MSAPTHELATVRDWLRYAVSRFNEAGLAFGHGTTNAWDEAAYLVLHALHLPLDRLEPFLDAKLTQPERAALAEVLARRVDERVPAAYLTHEAWLGHFRFYVDERVIVPRSYIAELLPDHLAPFVGEPDAVRTALDLCTGSGCLAILLADAFALADIDAVDVSADALAVAQRNVSDYGLAGRINLIRSDVYANLADKSYDLVISNPPYVTAVAMDNLPPEHRREPAIALAGGEDGLDVVRRIVKDAPRHLNPRGMLVMEIGDGRNAVEAAFPRLELTWLATASSDDSVFAVSREALVRG